MNGIDKFKRRRANDLRANQTDWERRLWRHLEKTPVDGTHFRRQVPLGSYIVDFASHRLKLVIEIDGAQHGHPAHARADFERDRWLESQGYRVLRFWNDDVRFELNAVLDTIFAAVEERRSMVRRG